MKALRRLAVPALFLLLLAQTVSFGSGIAAAQAASEIGAPIDSRQMSSAALYPKPRSAGGLTCQTVALSRQAVDGEASGASCDDVCARQGMMCVSVATDLPQVSPVTTCEDPAAAFSPSPTYCRCCSLSK